MKGRLLAVLVAALVAAGCALVEKGAGPAEGVTVLELEGFTLTKAEVKVLKEASGGKVVQLLDEASEASKTVELKAGKYELVVYGVAPSYEEDAFYIRVANLPEERLWMTDTGKLLPSSPLKFTLDKDGPCKVAIAFAEENVKLDRVEIKAVK